MTVLGPPNTHACMQMPGVDYLDDADMDLIMRIADPDEDGRVSLEDFKTIGSWAPPPETPTEAIRRIMVCACPAVYPCVGLWGGGWGGVLAPGPARACV